MTSGQGKRPRRSVRARDIRCAAAEGHAGSVDRGMKRRRQDAEAPHHDRVPYAENRSESESESEGCAEEGTIEKIDRILRAEKRMSDGVQGLTFDEPVTHVYNPLTYAWAGHEW